MSTNCVELRESAFMWLLLYPVWFASALASDVWCNHSFASFEFICCLFFSTRVCAESLCIQASVPSGSCSHSPLLKFLFWPGISWMCAPSASAAGGLGLQAHTRACSPFSSGEQWGHWVETPRFSSVNTKKFLPMPCFTALHIYKHTAFLFLLSKM